MTSKVQDAHFHPCVALSAALLIAPRLAFAVAGMPKFHHCPELQPETADAACIGETLASCIGDEKGATVQLARQWELRKKTKG